MQKIFQPLKRQWGRKMWMSLLGWLLIVIALLDLFSVLPPQWATAIDDPTDGLLVAGGVALLYFSGHIA
jgi:hypothetical protein